MHGLIFVSLRDYLAAEHGASTEHEVMAREPFYFVSQAYEDKQFTALVKRACALTGMRRERLLRDFGAFTAEKTFARLYPGLFDLSPNAHAFLLGVETFIHDIVRVAMPEARPPELDVSETDDGAISVVYTSPRRLCAMLRGLVEGTAHHYGEKVRIDEVGCMDRGDPACSFRIRFGSSS